jgi:hypothetical protein
MTQVDTIMAQIAEQDAAWFAKTPVWYRDGGTLNFRWRQTFTPNTLEAKTEIGERLWRQGYPTIQSETQPTEYQPAGYTPGKGML